MPELDPKIAELEARLDNLVRTQISFQTEISTIRRELTKLRGTTAPQKSVPPEPYATRPLSEPTPPSPQDLPPPQPPRQPPPNRTADVPPPTFGKRSEQTRSNSSATDDRFSSFVSNYTDAARDNLEKFIGENLISKIGIIVLVLGVGIGAKYAIDNGWITPLMRVVFGYVMGFGLLAFAVRFKTKYLNFSAVLLSGGMAIMYFVTYFAYAYYSLMPQPAAFILMAMFTVFTVAAAIVYDRQVIAHIGLVGAYAVPFLLSNNSGNYLFLFTYMAIINAGILTIAIKIYWKPLFYTSFGFTWLIYYAWFITKYSSGEHFYLALVFLVVFFATFYAMKIVHGVMHSENDDAESLISIIINGFVFYAFAFAISDVKTDVREYTVFFTYLAVISLAILITSFRYYGRMLIYLSYPFTWLIFGAWFINRYNPDAHFVLAATFAAVFFAVYYGATLVYRLIADEISMIENAGLVLTNSFVFYGFGYAIMDSRENLQGYEGLFTAGHAAFHSVVAQAVSRFRSAAVDVVQILTILIITFITIAVPVQFDGNYVTLIWAVEAAALFWFGRARSISLFEYFAYPLMVLATGSLFVDWITVYADRTTIVSEANRQPLANGDFITALVFVAAFSFNYVINRDGRYESAIDAKLIRPIGLAIGAVGLFVLYNTFRIEISNYFHMQAVSAGISYSISALTQPTLTSGYDLVRFNVIWQLNYTMFFLIAMCVVNVRKVRSVILAYAGVGLSVLSLFIFTTIAMYLFYELRVAYMTGESGGYFSGLMNIAIRYISYAFAAGLLYSIFRYKKDELLTNTVPANILNLGFDAIFYSTIFITVSCELINLMAQFHIPDGNKLGLSILWGIYALLLIVIGIACNKKHLRIAAIALLAVTLVKLFLYDVANLPTIPKTILFVSLGLLMLIVSFLYNKYRNFIFKPVEDTGE